MAKQSREHLVNVSLQLFHQYGFHATGIDKILAESGVAKNTLYRHFRSKDELILAGLRKHDENFRNWLMREVDRYESPIERLFAVFDMYEQWSRSPVFFGCIFINASAEFSDPYSPIHALCAEHKRLVKIYLRDLAIAADVVDPDNLAVQWMILLDGATTSTQVTNNSLAFQQAKAVAKNLLEPINVIA
ncbi:MAG: TetR/AcrR family transcriptional regulator [Kastovskya adunca ATA6-11-RM4]|jgi:AcrR family transcriptional regulator|nr:TetR/AcrR family transcriptional regulator [Kastovskya adunca ATA6-11-RM4]